MTSVVLMVLASFIWLATSASSIEWPGALCFISTQVAAVSMTIVAMRNKSRERELKRLSGLLVELEAREAIRTLELQ